MTDIEEESSCLHDEYINKINFKFSYTLARTSPSSGQKTVK